MVSVARAIVLLLLLVIPQASSSFLHRSAKQPVFELYTLHAENKSFQDDQAQSKYVELDGTETGDEEQHEIEYDDEVLQTHDGGGISSNTAAATITDVGVGSNNQSTDETIHTVVGILVDVLKSTWKYMQFVQQGPVSMSSNIQTAATAAAAAQSELEKLIESIIYACGVFRVFTSYSEVNRKRLSHMGFIECICNGMKITTKAYSQCDIGDDMDTSSTFTLQYSQLMLQLVSIMRNFVSDTHCKRHLLDAEIAPIICSTVHIFKSYPELVLNCSRVLSKLSLQDKHRDQINKKTYYLKCLVEVIVNEAKLCSKLQRVAWLHQESNGATDKAEGNIEWPGWSTWPLLSRVAFTLGNLTTSNESNRKFIGINCKILKPVILLLQTCCCSLVMLIGGNTDGVAHGDDKESEEYRVEEVDSSRDEDDQDDGEEDISEGNEEEKDLCDATIKLLRLLANLCMEEEVGGDVATRPEMFSVITDILKVLLQCPVGSRSILISQKEIVSMGSSKKFRDLGLLLLYEELLLNAIALSTNITYYACKNQQVVTLHESEMSSTRKHFVSVANNLSKFLFHENDEIVLETSRALGNLTRIQPVLRAFKGSRIDEAMCLLLRHTNKEVVSSTIGIFINLTSPKDKEGEIVTNIVTNKTALLEALLSTLRKLSLKYISISVLICKVLHNMINVGTNEEHEQNEQENLLPESLRERFIESLGELVDCARDLDDKANAKAIKEFVKIGCVVMGLLERRKNSV